MSLRWILFVAAVPVGSLALMYSIGMMLPEHHIAKAEITVRSPPFEVAQLIRDIEGHPRWRSEVTEIKVVERNATQVRYVEQSRDDTIAFQFKEERPGTRFRNTIVEPNFPFSGYWVIQVNPLDGGTAISIEEHGSVTNPVFRFLSHFIFGHTSRMKEYLNDLKNAADN